MNRSFLGASIWVVIFISTCPALCDVEVFAEQKQWQDTADDFTFIGFTQYPQGTILTDQYADLGIAFFDNNPTVLESDFFFEDGHGIWFDGPAGFDNIWVEFDEPITAIGADFLGLIQFEFFLDGESVYLSDPYSDNGGGFVGLVSDQSFDSVRIFNPAGGTTVDNLYFAPPIPGPGALGVFGIATLCFHRSRRR